MHNIKEYLLYSLLSILLVFMVMFGTKAYQQAIKFESITQELVVLQGAKSQAKLQLEKFATSILGGLISNKREVKLKKVKQQQRVAMQNAQHYTRYFIYLLFLLMLSYFIVSLRTFTLFGSLSALLTLFFGLITPILMITIHKQIDYLGDVVLSFESKGVIGSILKLFDSGDFIVAFTILIFSVLIPLLKVLAFLFVAIFMKKGFVHSIVKFFKLIGKWSMVDVFVVAIFLVYLTSNKGDVSRAEVEVGLYFFLAYVIVSMLLSLSADKMLREKIS